MPEKFNSRRSVSEHPEKAMVATESVDLHNKKVGVVVNGLRPLVSRKVAEQQYGIPGDVLATIVFPSVHPTESPKEVAFVDFGEGVDADHPAPVMIYEGKAVGFMGMATTRYGLQALDYTPKSHLATYVPVAPGARLELGQEGDRVSYKLGLKGEEEVGNEMIDPSHATIAFADGVLGIADHSLHGTRVTVASEQRISQAEWPREQAVGSLALLKAGVQGPE